MKRFYKVDENGTPIDNYCYRTSCPVKVIDNFITTDDENFVVTDISTDKFDIVDLEGDKDGYSFGNLKVNKGDPGEIVGGQDLIFLSMMAKRFQKIDDFRGYLGDVLGKEVTTNLVTSFNKYENFNAKEWQTWMNAYQFGMPMDGRLAYNNPGEEAGLHHYQVMPAKADYKGDDYALSSDQFQVHQQFSGSYFDVDSGSVKEDEPLYSIAFYYEGHKHKDDIAVLSQSNVAGYKLSEPTIFNDDRFAGQIKDNVVYDDGNMVVTSKTVDKGSDRTITTWDIKFNVLAQSMVKDTGVTYGEWEPTKAPSTQYFNIGQAKSIQDTIDDYNEEHTSDPLLDFQDFNNDAKYWVSYDMSNYESDEEHDALYQYTKELSNLQTLDQKYNSEFDKFNDKFKKLNGSNKITIDGELSEDTVDEIVAKIKLLEEYGRDTKGFVEPDDTCTDYKLLANVNYQLGEELKLDGENKVIPNYYPSYVVEPVLSYTKGGTTHDFELPIEVASILGTNNITVKLPLLQHDRSKDAVEFKYNEDIAEFGTNSSLLRAKVSTQNVTNNEEIDYFEVSVPNFAAYTLTSEQDGIYNYDDVKSVEGQAPTCSADGYKSCYEKNGSYYEDPTMQTPIADYDTWKTGAGKLNQLTTHDNIHFESKFDESTKEFTFDIICDDCGETIDTKILDGTFVKDSDADCTECAKGHYVAFGQYSNSEKSDKTLTLVGKTEVGSADEPGSTPEPHKLTHHFGIPATCTRNGIKPYWKCDDCEACFYDEGATQPVVDPEDLILSKLNHEMTYHPANEATETKSGNKEYWTCSHCNGFFLDEDGNEQTSESEILIPPTLHIYVQTAEMKEVRPTHYTSGHKAYYYCAKDNSYAIDSKGYEGIDDINVWLAPGGEGYIPKESCEFGGPVSYVISNDKCTATHACMYPGCKEVEQETVDATFIVDTPATCTEDARGHYIAEFTNPEFGTYSTSLNSDVRVGTATGHKFTVATPTWNGNLCTVSGTCENCHKSLSLTKEGTLVIDTPATCTTNAIGHYEVEFDNLRIEKQFTDPFTINNSALGHLFDNGECTRCHAKDPSAGAMSTGGIVGLTIGCSVGSVLIYAVVQYLINTKKIGKKKKTSKR